MIDELVEVKWKVGVSVSSNKSKKLMNPFVTLLMVTRDQDQHLHEQCFEMTLTEFQQFAHQVKNINKTFETL